MELKNPSSLGAFSSALTAVALFCTGCTTDQDGFSDLDGAATSTAMKKIKDNYGEFARQMSTDRESQFPNSMNPFAGSENMSVQQAADIALRALTLVKTGLDRYEFKLGSGRFDSGNIFYEDPDTERFKGNSFPSRDTNEERRWPLSVETKELLSSGEYEKMDQEAQKNREFLCQILTAASRQLSSQSKTETDPVRQHVLAEVIVKLPILIDRIQDKSLLSHGNVIRHTWKGGSSDTIIGRTENLDEVLSGLRYLSSASEF